MTTYSERLHVPLRWWVQAIMFIATLWLALIVALPESWAGGTTLGCIGLAALAFIAYGSAQIEVRDGNLRAGTAEIEGKWLTSAVALDAEATRNTAGRDVDVRAYLFTRPYLKRSVRVNLNDPSDPTPYWLISTRKPDQLVAAISSLTESNSNR